MPYYFKSGTEETLAYKIALVRPPSSSGLHPRRVALGLTSICGYLRGNGFECRIFDAQYHSWHEDSLLDRLIAYEPHLIGLSAMTHEIKAAARVARRVKDSLDAPVVIGGCHATALPRMVMDEFSAFDFGVHGEGERVFLQLAQRLRDSYREAAHDIDGLMYREGDEVTINARPALLTPDELSRLPFPPMDDYFGDDPGALKARDACYSLIASRGSTDASCFDMQVLGRSVRHGSAERVVDEMFRAIAHWGAHTFEFHDEMFLGDSAFVSDLLKRMLGKKLPEVARWTASVRIEHVNASLLSLAAQAGCYKLDLFVGSGDDGLIRSLWKGAAPGAAKQAVRAMQAAGIKVNARFILGHPYETGRQARRTVNMVHSLCADSVTVDLVVPYPGTGVYEMALRHAGGYRLLSHDWTEYDQYGRSVVEIRGLSRWRLRWLRHLALACFYLKTLRLLDLAGYLWRRRQVYSHALRRSLGIKIVTKESFTG